MKKTILALLTLVIIVFIVNSNSYKTVKPVVAPSPDGMVAGEQTENNKTVSLVLDFGDGKVATYSVESADSALEALEKTVNSNNIPLSVKEFSFGKLVETIGDKTNSKEKAWLYFVNGKAADVGADQYEVEEGDVVEWKYMKAIY